MTIEKYGYKWNKKPSGYYQSTSVIGKSRQWLHQYTYRKEVGNITDGYCVHHIDHNKDNNDYMNLSMITHGEHMVHHNHGWKKGHKITEDVQRLAQLAKQGKYVGKHKRRSEPKPDKFCDECNSKIDMKTTSIKGTRFCSNKCRDFWWRKDKAIKSGKSYIKISGTTRECVICEAEFSPKSYNAKCCSKECSKESYRLKALAKRIK